MAGKRVHFVMPADLVERMDAALVVGVSRGEFVRKAVERALGDAEQQSVALSPAEQPDTRAMDLLREDDPDPDFVARGCVPEFPPAREFRPYPKGGKR